jgi:hypothetical protein
MQEVMMMSHGCHTYNWIAQHPMAKCPGARVLPRASDEEEVVQSGPGQQAQTPPSTSWWTCPSCPALREVQYTPLEGGTKWKKDNEAPRINDSSSPLSPFLLYFAQIIMLRFVETNRYYHSHLDRLDKRTLPLPDVMEAEKLVSCDNNINGTCLQDKLLGKVQPAPHTFLW